MRTEPFGTDDLTCDDFLGGLVRLWQPRDGYRAGIDPVLLAASVAARPGQTVLDLGCGGGVALICLGARLPGLALWGLELQPGYADLARRNLARNGLDGQIVTGDLGDMPPPLKALAFDHVIANPPYFDARRRTAAADSGRERALAGDATNMQLWIAAAARRLRPGGTFTMIHRAERLPDLLAPLQAHLGSVELLPLAPRAGRAPRLVLLRARKGGRGAFRFHAPRVLHQDTAHRDGPDSHTPDIEQVVRHGGALSFGEV